MNVYQYCGGNPVMFADPSGLWPWDDWGDYWHKMGQFGRGMGKSVLGVFTGVPVSLYRVGQHMFDSNDYAFMNPVAAFPEVGWENACGFWDMVKKASDGDCDAGGQLTGTVLLSALGAKAPAATLRSGLTVAETATLRFGSTTYAARIFQRMKEGGLGHNFPWSFDSVILRYGTVSVGKWGYKRFHIPGAMNGNSGYYEIGGRFKNGRFIIEHRTFTERR